MGKAKIIVKNVDINHLKEKRKKELSDACGLAIVENFQSKIVLESTGRTHIFGVDTFDQINMQQKLLMLLNDRSTLEVLWKTDSGVVTLTREEFIAVVKEIGNKIENARMKLVGLKTQVDYCTSETEIGNIVWK